MMSSWKRNNQRADVISRFGSTVGLPLFESNSKKISDVAQKRFEAMPKSIPTGAETRHLSFTILHHDQLRLSLLCQKVWEAFAEFGPATNFEIAQRLGKESGWVSARNNQLRELGLLTFDTKRRCKVTGEISSTWKAL